MPQVYWYNRKRPGRVQRRYSTDDHIAFLHSEIDLKLFTKKCRCRARSDYKKAFDVVDHEVSLWRKLIANHINDKAITVIHNLYKNAA